MRLINAPFEYIISVYFLFCVTMCSYMQAPGQNQLVTVYQNCVHVKCVVHN